MTAVSEAGELILQPGDSATHAGLIGLDLPIGATGRTVSREVLVLYVRHRLRRRQITWSYGPVDVPASPLWESPFDIMIEKRPLWVEDLIEHVARHLRAPYGDRLARRLAFLQQISQEDAGQESTLSAESLRYFIALLQTNPALKYPDVVLTPSGNVRAEWHEASDRHLAVEFLPDGECRFVLFVTNHIHPEKTLRLSGMTSVDAVLETVIPHGAMNWAAHG